MVSKWKYLGQSIPPLENIEFVTGQARYVADDAVPGMIHGVILHSPYAHANIKSIDISKAESMPGVRAILTHENSPNTRYREMRVLDNKVRFWGDEVLAVAADTEEIAEEAIRQINIDYELLPVVIDPEEALEPNAPLLYPNPSELGVSPPMVGNMLRGEPTVCNYGDIDKGFSESDFILDGRFHPFPQPVAPLGRFGAIAWWEGKQLKLIESTQVPNTTQDRLITYLESPLGLTYNNTRVISKHMGTGMGEFNTYRYYTIAALLAKMSNRPVKLIEDRRYAFWMAKRRSDSVFYMRVGATNNGELKAMDARGYWNKGADNASGPQHTATRVITAYIPYHRGKEHLWKCSNKRQEFFGVLTNQPGNGAYRNYSCSETYWTSATLVNRVAEKLNLNPLEFWLSNLDVEREYKEYPLPAGAINPVRSVKAIQRCAEVFGWSQRWQPTKSKTGIKRRGVGMCAVVGWSSSYPKGYHLVTVLFEAGGLIKLQFSEGDAGMQHKDTFPMVVAECMDMPVENITSYSGDTILPPNSGCTGSKTALGNSYAIYLACEDLKRQMFDKMAGYFNVKPEDLAVGDGKVYVKNSPDKSRTYAQVFSTTGRLIGNGNAPTMKGETDDVWGGPRTIIYGEGNEDVNPFSCQMAEIEVDTESGHVDVLKVTSVFDVGQCINTRSVQSQLESGVMLSVGFGISEDVIYDRETGVCLNGDFLGYKLLTLADHFEVDAVPYEDEPNPCHPFGVRGCGEPCCIGVAPAINNALYNAIGANCNDCPITPDKVLALLGKV